jgi:ATP-dependent exoDNAse (exonuclease V) beta subunit
MSDFLEKKNNHSRDSHITFDEGPHIYTVKGDSSFTSVTTWVHSHFAHFDAKATIDKILNSSKMSDPNYKYFNMTKEQIKKMWDDKRIASSTAGTKMHYDIECFYNEMKVKNKSIEYKYFKNFVKDFPELKAFRTEWMVYYEELKLSGSIDMVFELPDGSLQIYDWKRCEEIVHEPSFLKYSTTDCVKHLPDSNFWHYSLQLNIYRGILEKKYGKKISGLYLVCLHPNNMNKNYDRIEVPFLDSEIDNLFKLRLQQIS